MARSPSRGRTSGTPSSRRYCSSSGSAGAMTVAPAWAASCTAKLPTPPVAPTMSTVSPSDRSSATMAVTAVMAASGAAPAAATSMLARRRAIGDVGGDGDELGPAAVVRGRVGVQQEAEDLIPGRVVGDVGPDLLDDAGVVAAEGDGVLVVDAHLGEHARGDGVVDGVDGRRLDADEHLARAGGRGGHVVAQRGRRAGFVEGDGLHVVSFLVILGSSSCSASSTTGRWASASSATPWGRTRASS